MDGARANSQKTGVKSFAAQSFAFTGIIVFLVSVTSPGLSEITKAFWFPEIA